MGMPMATDAKAKQIKPRQVTPAA